MRTRRPRTAASDPGLRDILEELRTSIVDNRLRAGVRLPSVRDLAQRYGVAANTIHRCLQELTAAGFLSTNGRHGTRVVDFPPHRHRFGLVLPRLPADDGTYPERHWQAKVAAALAITTAGGRQIELFHGINSHPELTHHVHLLAAITQRRLAGLIILDESLIADWLVPARLQIPIVGVTPVPGTPSIGNLLLEPGMFMEQALDAVAAHGVRRTAVLGDVSVHRLIPAMQAHAGVLGLELPQRSIQTVPNQCPEWAVHAVAGLFDRPAVEQPEALILTDEMSIPAVESALDGLGIGALFQVHLANLPLPRVARRPALRLGWDHRRYLLRAMELIDAWHETRRPIGHEVMAVEHGL